jgi:hypothetical protein
MRPSRCVLVGGLQIRRSSYHDVIRVSEIQKVLDISGVRTACIGLLPGIYVYAKQLARGLEGTRRPQGHISI